LSEFLFAKRNVFKNNSRRGFILKFVGHWL